MQLSDNKDTLRLIHDGILDAYDRASFERVLYFSLAKMLSHITPRAQTFSHIVFNVVETANREGWLYDLVYATHLSNPTNKKLASLVAQIDADNSRENTDEKTFKEFTSEINVHKAIDAQRDVTRRRSLRTALLILLLGMLGSIAISSLLDFTWLDGLPVNFELFLMIIASIVSILGLVSTRFEAEELEQEIIDVAMENREDDFFLELKARNRGIIESQS